MLTVRVFFAYAILTMDECALFTNTDSIDDTAKGHLQTGGVTVLHYDEIWSYLTTWGQQLAKARESSQPPSEEPKPQKDGDKKNADPTHKASISGKTSWAIAEALGKVSYTDCRHFVTTADMQDNVEVGRSLVEDMKAQKNAVSFDHWRDGS